MSESTLKDVASRAGVSLSTASLVLNDRPGTRIAQETRRRVWEAAREVGYRVRTTSRPLRIHFLAAVSDAPSPYESLSIFAMAQEHARERNAVLQATYAGGSADEQLRCVERLADGGADGLLVIERLDAAAMARLVALRIPTVLVGSWMHTPQFSAVHSDNLQGMSLLMDHLWGLGHRRLAFCGQRPDMAFEEQRHQVYLSRLMRAGVMPDADWTCWARSAADVEQWIGRLLRLSPGLRPTAIIADQKAQSRICSTALERLGCRVPEEMSLVVFDDPCAEEIGYVPLTCVRRPLEAIVRLAVDRLLEELDHPDQPRLRMALPVELIVRASSGPPVGAQSSATLDQPVRLPA